MRLVDRGQRRAPIDSGEPARVAMGEHVHAAVLTSGDVCDHGLPMMADQAAGFDILIRHLRGFRIGRRHALRRRNPAERLLHLAQRPVEIHGSGSRGGQSCASAFEPGIGGVRLQRQGNPVSRRNANQRRSAHLHDLDGAGGIGERGQRKGFECVRKARLIDDADRAITIVPDRTVVNALNFHISLPRATQPFSSRLHPSTGSG